MLPKEQQEAIGRLVSDFTNTPDKVTLEISLSPFDLPANYVAFTLTKGTFRMYGGIAPDGRVST